MLSKFESGGVCSPLESLALIKARWVAIDVRTPEEHSAHKVPGAVNVPLMYAQWRHRNTVAQRRNSNFIQTLAMLYPDKSTPLLIYCSDGRQRSIAALHALDAAGYTRLVGLHGGHNAFARAFERTEHPEVAFPKNDAIAWLVQEEEEPDAHQDNGAAASAHEAPGAANSHDAVAALTAPMQAAWQAASDHAAEQQAKAVAAEKAAAAAAAAAAAKALQLEAAAAAKAAQEAAMAKAFAAELEAAAAQAWQAAQAAAEIAAKYLGERTGAHVIYRF